MGLYSEWTCNRYTRRSWLFTLTHSNAFTETERSPSAWRPSLLIEHDRACAPAVNSSCQAGMWLLFLCASWNNLSLHQVDQINYWKITLTSSIYAAAVALNATGCSCLNEERDVHVSLGVWQTERGQSDLQWVWPLGLLCEMEVTVTVKHSPTNETKLVQSITILMDLMRTHPHG